MDKIVLLPLCFYCCLLILGLSKAFLLWDFTESFDYSRVSGSYVGQSFNYHIEHLMFSIQLSFIVLIWTVTLLKEPKGLGQSLQPIMTISIMCLHLCNTSYSSELFTVVIVWMIHISSNRYQRPSSKKLMVGAYVFSCIVSHVPWVLKEWVKRGDFFSSQDRKLLENSYIMCFSVLMFSKNIKVISIGLINAMIWIYGYKTIKPDVDGNTWSTLILLISTIYNFIECLNCEIQIMESSFKFIIFRLNCKLRSLKVLKFHNYELNNILYEPEFCNPFNAKSITSGHIFFTKGPNGPEEFQNDESFKNLPAAFDGEYIRCSESLNSLFEVKIKERNVSFTVNEIKAKQLNFAQQSGIPLVSSIMRVGKFKVAHCESLEVMAKSERLFLRRSESPVYFAGWDIDLEMGVFPEFSFKKTFNKSTRIKLGKLLMVHSFNFFKIVDLNKIYCVLNCECPKKLRKILGNSASKTYSSQVNYIISEFTKKNNNLNYSVKRLDKVFEFDFEQEIKVNLNMDRNEARWGSVVYKGVEIEMSLKQVTVENVEATKGTSPETKPKKCLYSICAEGLEIIKNPVLSSADEFKLGEGNLSLENPVKKIVVRINKSGDVKEQTLNKIKEVQELKNSGSKENVRSFFMNLNLEGNEEVTKLLKRIYWWRRISYISQRESEIQHSMEYLKEVVDRKQKEKDNSKNRKVIREKSQEIQRISDELLRNSVEKEEILKQAKGDILNVGPGFQDFVLIPNNLMALDFTCEEEDIRGNTDLVEEQEPVIRIADLGDGFISPGVIQKSVDHEINKKVNKMKSNVEINYGNGMSKKERSKKEGELTKRARKISSYGNSFTSFMDFNRRAKVEVSERDKGKSFKNFHDVFRRGCSYNKILYKGVEIKAAFNINNRVWRASSWWSCQERKKRKVKREKMKSEISQNNKDLISLRKLINEICLITII